ncbi:MAG: (d)CMP kinase [Planctomycetes bacterium]|nr:(d)CMP kinase [Planctomycetota bacterium]
MSPVPDPSANAAREVPVEVVAIDGPAGAGKSTVAKRLAAALGWAHLDTGAMFRAVTLRLLEDGLLAPGAAPSTLDGAAVASTLATLTIAIDDAGRVWLDGRDVTARLREPAVDAGVSAVAALGAVRERLREAQRDFARGRPTVAEGRDIGTVVFPRAAFKIWLDADVEERARRRRADLAAAGHDPGAADVVADLVRRDTYDSSRALAPLTRAADAIAVDTTGLSIDEVVAKLRALVTARVPGTRELHR